MASMIRASSRAVMRTSTRAALSRVAAPVRALSSVSRSSAVRSVRASVPRATPRVAVSRSVRHATHQMARVAPMPMLARSVTTASVVSERNVQHAPNNHMEKVFGENCFNTRAMRRYLPPKVFKEIQHRVNTHQPINAELTEAFAASLLHWATDRGATHFTHWFLPLTNKSASKHDSFMVRSGDHVISSFTGKTLARNEPDASSFPNGGLRGTHQARGYTVWDPSSPCFIISHDTGTTLYIPSIFISWKGNALDEKTPLLRSTQALNKFGIGMLHAAGFKEHSYMHADSGVEQEFFIVDRDFYLRRPDLIQTGRTLLGRQPPKGQALSDHYFTELNERTMRLINEAEIEMWKLGIPQTTRHKEVAPGQYEIAPVFSAASVASDQNVIAMEALQRVAHHHGMEILFHEKPFAGLNGSGKHNNWSVGTDQLGTVFNPGDKPQDNAIFMLFVAATFRAVHLHQDLMRVAIASTSNDHRLGAQEAPPAIVSIYLGEDLTEAIHKFANLDGSASKFDATRNLGVSCLPDFKIDSTDRNRTSPFAFTGNKFEFRAVGSSQFPHRSNFILNSILADSCRWFAEEIEKRLPKGGNSKKRQEVALEIAREQIVEHKNILFDGDCYSEAWHQEAKERGLLNLRTTPDALAQWTSKKNQELFKTVGVLSPEGLQARCNIWLEEYITKVSIEANSVLMLVNTQVLPAALKLQGSMAANAEACKSAGAGISSSQQERLARINKTIGSLIANAEALEKSVAKLGGDGHGVSDALGDLSQTAHYAKDNVLTGMLKVRADADELEGLCSSREWPLPSYHDMMFTGHTFDVELH